MVLVTSDADRPELGRFLVADRPLARGELLLREEPLLRTTGPRQRAPFPDAAAVAASLRGAELFVPCDDVSAAVRRVRAEAPAGESEDVLFIREVMHFNSFSTGSAAGCCVFATLSRANHSCKPSCTVESDKGILRTLRDISVGEELTISYLKGESLLLPRERRMAELQDHWEFSCCCERCAAPADDMRRFRACAVDGCDGDLLAIGLQVLRCERCGAEPAAETARALLDAEAGASSVMARVRGARAFLGRSDSEEEQLLPCVDFASWHPRHATTMELAHAFDLADPISWKRALLTGLRVAYPDCGHGLCCCSLAVATGRELGDLLEEQGEAEEARSHLEAASAAACFLEGQGSPEAVLERWRREASEKAARVGADPGREQEDPVLAACLLEAQKLLGLRHS